MASGPITSWEVDGETVAEFKFLGSKITAEGDCSHVIKGSLLLGSRVLTNLDSILKSRASVGEGGVIWENCAKYFKDSRYVTLSPRQR